MKHVLAVDDSKAVRILLKRAFSAYDVEITEASNGEEALNRARAQAPDLVLLDVTMPVLDGAETLAQFKADPALKTIPVVMLTAEGGQETILKLAKLGVRDYIVKPFQPEALMERLNRIVAFELKTQPAAT